MAVLDKIRTKFGFAASIIIALGLLMFIVSPDDIIRDIQNMSSRNEVGKIAGKPVSYSDFQEEVKRVSDIYELTSGSRGADMQEQAREEAWQMLVNRYVLIENARKAGINVGNDEMKNLFSGASPLVMQYGIFYDENGNFSPALVKQFQQLAQTDPNAKLILEDLQNKVYTNQFFQKYFSLFTGSDATNPLMLRRDIAENNNTSDVDFVMVPYGYQQDTTIVVTDSEIRDYYKAHKKFFRQPASRDIEYVVFEVVPSAEDIESTRQSMLDILDDFEAAEDMKSFLARNGSERQYTGYWYKKGQLRSVNPEIENFVWEGGKEVSDVVTAGNSFYLAKVVATKNIPDSVYVRHILLQGNDADNLADSLLNVLQSKGDTFVNVAALYSADQNSMFDGELGNLGWMTQDNIIRGFESALESETGKPYIQKTPFGTHILEVVRKTAPVEKKQVAIMHKNASASTKTIEGYYSQANNFATAAAGKYENYRKAVDTLGVYSHPVYGMLESASSLGSVQNTKEVTRWAFDNKAGSVSPIFTIDNNLYYVVATVKGIHKEGYADVSEVASQIRSTLYSEKLGTKMAAEIQEKIAGLSDLDAIAEKLGATVSHQSGIAFSSMGARALDPAFIGALSVAPVGQISKPVAGSLGVFVFKVNEHDTGEFYTEDDAKTRDMQMAQVSTQMLLPTMMEAADVKDNRARFF